MSSAYYDMVPKDKLANLNWRKELTLMAGTDLQAAAEIKSMCGADILFYLNSFCWTYDPRSKESVIPFNTYPFQDDAIMDILGCIDGGRDFAMPKSRDMGASWMGLAVFEWCWHFRSNQSFLLISRNEDYVDKTGNPKALFWKIDFIHKNQPRWLLPRNMLRRLLHIGNGENGSVIDGESTTGDAGRGDRRTAMFIDEHAAFNVDDGFRVLRATRDTTKCRGFNSTPQGSGNAFYEVCNRTSAKVIRLHWSKHPEKNKGLYRCDKVTGEVVHYDEFCGDVEIRKKGEKDVKAVFYPDEYPYNPDGKLRSPWYDNECARCVSEMEIGQELDIDFLGSDYQFFDQETIQLLIDKNCTDPETRGELEYDVVSFDPKRYTENDRGRLHLWLRVDRGSPPKEKRYAIGADISAGTGASNSVASVVDLQTGEKVAVWRDSHTRPNSFAKQVMALGKWFNMAYLIWDASGPTGEVFTKRVLESGYGNIYYRRNEKKVTKKISDEPGYYLNPAAKTALFEDYRDALGEHQFINRSRHGMLECLQFVRRPDGTIEHSASLKSQDPSGARTAHGDEVVADALANQYLSEVREDRLKNREREVPDGCLAWRRKRKEEQNRLVTLDVLGEGW